MHPTGTMYTGGEGTSRDAKDRQEVTLIFTEDSSVQEVELSTLPEWAKSQIELGIRDRELIAEGYIVPVTPGSESIVPAEPERQAVPDYGILGLPISAIKKQSDAMSVEQLTDLLDKEKQGLNTTARPRAGLVNFLEEKLKAKG
jgi:hypothetical protein